MFCGTRLNRPEDVAAVLAILNVTGSLREYILDVYSSSRDNEWNWLLEDADHPAGRLGVLANLERDATSIVEVASSRLPRLLHADATDRGAIDRCACRFLIDESVINGLGSEHVHHLLRLSVQPNVDIRVITEGWRGVFDDRIIGEQFEILECRNTTQKQDTQPTVCVYIETMTAAMVLGRPTTVSAYREVAEQLWTVAMSQATTRQWLAQAGAALDGDSLDAAIDA
jgi:hypothetical protein